MSIEGVDFAFGRPGGAALAAAGKHFVVRYITGAGLKALTAAEIADYHAHGLSIALVFESTRGRVLGGRPAGIADATQAIAACTALRIPTSTRIYFAVDFDAQPDQQPAIDAYLGGAASVLGLARVGVYGGIHVIERCQASRSASGFWQTYAWSGGRINPLIHLYQYHNGQTINGAAVDLCRAYRADFGQFPQPLVAPTTYHLSFTGGAFWVYTTDGKPFTDSRGVHYGGTITGRHAKRFSGPTGAPCGAPLPYAWPHHGSRKLVKVSAGGLKGQLVAASQSTVRLETT